MGILDMLFGTRAVPEQAFLRFGDRSRVIIPGATRTPRGMYCVCPRALEPHGHELVREFMCPCGEVAMRKGSHWSSFGRCHQHLWVEGYSYNDKNPNAVDFKPHLTCGNPEIHPNYYVSFLARPTTGQPCEVCREFEEYEALKESTRDRESAIPGVI